MTGLIRSAALGLAIVLAASACTPAEMATWLQGHEKPVPKSDEKLNSYADLATQFWTAVFAKVAADKRAAAAAATPVATPAAAPAAGSYGYPWDQLVRCEATGNWHANSGNGYYGGLQFAQTTWMAYGGGSYASRPDLAAPPAQIAVAQRIVASNGGSYRAWPACRSRLGLP